MTLVRSSPRPRRTQAERSDSTRETLLLGLTRVIAEHGLEGATLLRVAQEAHSSVGAIQHHFGGLDAMILPVINRCAGLVLPSYSCLSDTQLPAVDRIRSLVRAHVRVSYPDEHRAWIQLISASVRNLDVRSLTTPHVEHARNTLCAGLESVAASLGVRLRTASHVAAQVLLCWLHGAALHPPVDQASVDEQSIALEAAVRSLLMF